MYDRFVVLPTARAVRHRQLQTQDTSLLLEPMITMGDFLENITYLPNYKKIDADTRVLLLLEASAFEKFSALQIQRNFFTFTKNSSYIIKFFEELSAEMCAIEDLDSGDIYGEYEEHITILQELYHRYKCLCDERKLLDPIFLPYKYILNSSYLKKAKRFEIHLDGYLTNFELQLLEQSTKYTQIEIIFNATSYNEKMANKFRQRGFEVTTGYQYRLLLNDRTIKEVSSLQSRNSAHAVGVSEDLLQIAFIKERIFHFIAKGYEPQNIALILPNETKVALLQEFDTKSNLNFAMGIPFSLSTIYKKLDAAIRYLDEQNYENIYRVQKFGDEIVTLLSPLYKAQLNTVEVDTLFDTLYCFINDKREKKIFEEEVYSFKKIIPYLENGTIRSALHLFMQRLRGRTLDDIRGGKITVMGVLETRLVSFDAVIIIDFDDNNVPKRSQKDMFLNTQVRKSVGLPTSQERQNLQKHYYDMLMRNAKEVAICYVDASHSQPSRFLKELGITTKSFENEDPLSEILFKRTYRASMEEQSIVIPYSFKDIPLSASRLKVYLRCKRRYYYQYIQHIGEHQIPEDIPKEYEIGSVIHKALQKVYEKAHYFSSYESLKKACEEELELLYSGNVLQHYLILLKKKELDLFYKNELQRFEDGWRVYSVEQRLQTTFADITIQGTLDRIDQKENILSVLDYKTGNYPLYTPKNVQQATDFQLEFYYLLASTISRVEECGYYDLKTGVIQPEALFEEKLELLRSHIIDLLKVEELECVKCEDTKECLFCPYKIMCGRD